MQPCSHPRYGLIERSNPMSGDSLRVMMERATSCVTAVASGGRVSSSASSRTASGSGARSTDSKRWARFETAPRPLRASASGTVTATTGSSPGIRWTGSSAEVPGKRALHLRRDFVEPHRVVGMIDAHGNRRALPDRRNGGRLEFEAQEVDGRGLLLVLALE